MNPTDEMLKQIYSLSFSINSAFGLSFKQTDCKSGMTDMQNYVSKISNDVLTQTTQFIGNWKALWGPIVYANDPTSNSVHADNTMGMFYNSDENLIVIAVAGTNVNSPFGWIVEDFTVNTTVSWQSVTGAPNSGNIATGTHTGLQILLDMKNNNGETLVTALKNFVGDSTTPSGLQIAVAGHSLGGALSPTLALYLVDKKADWDTSNKASVGAFPTAGPTPGDKTFATYYESLIKSNKIYYLSQHNAIDVVPHAWQKEDLEKIPGIYQSNIVPPSGANPKETITGTLTAAAALNALTGSILPSNKYKQISPSTTLNGTFDTTVDAKVTKKLKYINWVLPSALGQYADYLRNLARFAAQAGAQHTTAYYPLLHIEAFMAAYDKILANNRPTNDMKFAYYEYAVKDIAKIDLRKISEAAMQAAAQNSN